MKFKDKNGNVFEDIVTVLRKFRCPGPCDPDCPLCLPAYRYGRTDGHPICEKYVVAHPAEAARLMGYEVVEETQQKSEDESEEHKKKVKEEAKMDKQRPRICEILGVEIGEKFSVRDTENGYISAHLEVTSDGHVVISGKEKNVSGVASTLALHAINHPESIVRQSAFTPDEVAFARLFGAACRSEIVFRRDEKGILTWGSIDGRGNNFLPWRLLPSLRPGQFVMLSDILKNAPKNE